MERWMKSARANAAGLILLAIAAGSCVDSTAPTALTAPTNVTVTMVAPRSAKITWTPAAAPEVYYVETYFIYRDGVKIGESVTTSFTDNGLTEGATYKYRVAAFGIGLASEQSAESSTSVITVPDVTAPAVTSTNPANGGTGVALASTVSATFSEAIDPSTLNATTFILRTSGGAALPGIVSYNATTRVALLTPSAALPNASSLTATITTGVKDLAGNRLATDFLFSFSTRDEVPPTVVSISPANGATGVLANAPLTVTFNEPMDAASINATSIVLKLTSSGASVPGNVTYNTGTFTATFTPAAALAFGTSYTLTATTATKDAGGNALGANAFSTFTTTGAPDTTPPTVVAVSPANGASNVSVNTPVTVTFSEAMDASTLTGSISLTVASNSSPVSASVSYNTATNTATLTPSAALAFATAYTITVSTTAKDPSGNSLASTVTAGFSTTSAPDITPPSVVSVSPPNLTSGVSAATIVAIVFSEAMNPSSINTSTIVLSVTGTSSTVTGTVSYNSATNTATFTPASALAFSTSYTITVSGVTDLSGNGLSSPFSSIFATGAAPDVTPPTVSSTNPTNFASGVARTVAPTVTFSEAMNASTINGSTITLSTSGAPVAGAVTYDATSRTATFTPSSPLSFSTSYALTVTTGVQDVAGNPMAAQFSSSFTVMANPDTTRPTVISSTRIGAAGPPLENRSMASITFSEPMNAATINTSTVTMKSDLNNSPVSGTVTYDSNTNTAFFLASSPLTYSDQPGGTSYTLSVSTGAADLAGNTLASPFTQSSTRLGYFQGTNDPTVAQPAQVHIHVTFAQSGSTLGLAVECTRLSGGADCDVLPRNDEAFVIFGPLDDGAAATITGLTGTFTNPGITFTFTLANGKSFTFTGSMTNANSMSGTLTGATLSQPISIVLSR